MYTEDLSKWYTGNIYFKTCDLYSARDWFNCIFNQNREGQL